MAEVEPNNSHQKKTTKNKKKHLPKYAQFLLTGIAGCSDWCRFDLWNYGS